MIKIKKILPLLLITVMLVLVGCANSNTKDTLSYQITIDECINGTITCDKTNGKAGDTITVFIAPFDGYIIKNGTLKYNDSLISSNTFKMLSENIVISGEFIETLKTKYKKLSYGNDAIQKYDLYVSPNAIEDKINGALVFIHGGFWAGGTKEYYSKYLEEFLVKYPDYIVVNMDYHLIIPLVNLGISMYTMLDDITLCLSDVKQRMYEYGIDLTNVALGGHSAGGQLAMMYSYTKLDVSPIPIKFCLTCSGPTDFSDTELVKYREIEYGESDIQGQMLDSIMYNLAGYDNIEDALANTNTISPKTFITNKSTPTIMAYGKRDALVPFSNPTILYDILNSYKITNEMITFENSGHSLNNDPKKMDYLFDTVNTWANTYFE